MWAWNIVALRFCRFSNIVYSHKVFPSTGAEHKVYSVKKNGTECPKFSLGRSEMAHVAVWWTDSIFITMVPFSALRILIKPYFLPGSLYNPSTERLVLRTLSQVIVFSIKPRYHLSLILPAGKFASVILSLAVFDEASHIPPPPRQ